MTDAKADPGDQWAEAMGEAIALASSDDVFTSENPRVGCVIVDADGAIVGRGWHRGAGTPHAEVNALADAGSSARGGTAVVTLEPCNHVGRTGPCSQALIDAGIRRVVYAVDDPHALASGGGSFLEVSGIDVVRGVLSDDAAHANRAWLTWLATGRPLVTLKCAMSLDGRVADHTGGPTAITGEQAQAYSHALRRTVDAIAVGTGTVMSDNPRLTARDANGSLSAKQPLRVVVGESEIPRQSHVCDDSAPTFHFTSHDLDRLLEELAARNVQHLLVEGGPTLAGALLDAGLVDEVVWFLAPVLIGAGPVSLPALGTSKTVAVGRVLPLGDDVLVEGKLVDVHRHR